MIENHTHQTRDGLSHTLTIDGGQQIFQTLEDLLLFVEFNRAPGLRSQVSRDLAGHGLA
jgi:hypothetical protein